MDDVVRQIDSALDDIREDVDKLGPTQVNTDLKSMAPSKRYWIFALVVGVLFFVLATPQAFKFTSRVAASLKVDNYLDFRGCPSLLAVGVHAVVALLLVRLLLQYYH